jgi:isopenicillin-N epimerase
MSGAEDLTSIRARWGLDPGLDFLNHGSFGACPRSVLEVQARLRDELERSPVDFMVRRLPARMASARARLAGFLGASASDLVAVPNATHGVSTVLRSLPLGPGDRILVTDHGYAACNNAARRRAEETGAELRVARVPFPIDGPDRIEAAVLDAIDPAVRLVILDHVTSPTAIRLPVERLVPTLESRGVPVLVDGAHAPGLLPLALDALGASFYTGNLHKWVMAPKGAAFLHVRRDRQDLVRPLATSHGFSAPDDGRHRFEREHEWTGTWDPTPFLAAEAALDHGEALGRALCGIEDGWAGLRARQRGLALEARAILSEILDVTPPAPPELITSMVTLPLPDGDAPSLYHALFHEDRIEVPVFAWPSPPRRWVRISAQVYNEAGQYRRLAERLRARTAGSLPVHGRSR